MQFSPRSDGESEQEQRREPSNRLPPQLHDWRVMEVEGSAASVEDGGRPMDHTPDDHRTDDADSLTDHFDDLVVLTVPNRRLSLAPGESDALSVSLLNNGELAATFEITVQGEPGSAWFPDLPLHVPLRPGERQTFNLEIAPPPGPTTRAGEYAFVVVATSSAQPERRSRAACALTIQPYTDFRVGMLQPERVGTSWWTPAGQTAFSVTNLSNHSANFEIVGADQGRQSLFEFDTPRDIFPQTGKATFTLEPGESGSVGVTILPRRQPAVSLAAEERAFRVAVQFADENGQVSRQTIEGRIVSKALIGPWQLAGIAGVAAALLAVIMVTSAVMLLALRSPDSPPLTIATPIPAPAFALVLSMDEPVPTNGPPAATAAVMEPVPAENRPSEAAVAPDQGGLAVVQADQVTSPGEPAPTLPPAPARPTPVPVAPPNAGSMTYAQMFQQIAARYDLNWRILAAQGYVESGFDSTAIGKRGSLGLMQVHPDTWQEWAPRVDASDPFDTYSNVLVAAIYLDYLRYTLGQQNRPQVEWMLAAYNWGPDKVLDLLTRGGEWTDLPAEVQQYAVDVLRIAQSIPDK